VHLVESATPCQQSDPDLWFAEGTAETEHARLLCHACHLRAACLAGALARAEPWGVWGGEVLQDGQIIPVKRGRGRPRKVA
jgi:WhiB family redox-sensing transcriptional regulator